MHEKFSVSYEKNDFAVEAFKNRQKIILLNYQVNKL